MKAAHHYYKDEAGRIYWNDAASGVALALFPHEVRIDFTQGAFGSDIAVLRNEAWIAAQLSAISKEQARDALRFAGAQEDSLRDHDANLSRILWIACAEIDSDLKAPEETQTENGNEDE